MGPFSVRSGAMATVVLLALATMACRDDETLQEPTGTDPSAQADASVAVARADSQAPAYIGTSACAACHPEQADRWRGSHHDLAMQVAEAGVPLGDFGDVRATHRDRMARFLRRDGRTVVETRDADGALRTFEVAYTFGVDPIQQLLIAFPDGRLQALDFAWAARSETTGGQRWIALQPEETARPGDVLHWTGPAYRWNSMCADCHSTSPRSDYDPEADRWSASWSEIDVGCEACHGPGGEHVRRAHAGGLAAGSGLAVDLEGRHAWTFAPNEPIARRAPATPDRRELDVCAPCHARRSRIVATPPPGGPFLDGHRPALLEDGLYHPDGQILDEVFVWGSFVQSPMHAAGVTCSDCHDPHALAIETPDATCAGCHRPEVFAAPEHHHHPADSAGASCVACHMPARTYMVVDDRRDHGFRVPRPDLAAELGVPEPCTGCHPRRDAGWAAEVAAAWWGTDRRAKPHWSEALAAGRARAAGTARPLIEVATHPALPPIVRATAVSLLGAARGGGDDAAVTAAWLRAAGDAEPLVRMAAAEAGEAWAPALRAQALVPRLRDPRRAVRIAAGRSLATLPEGLLGPADRVAVAEALEEWRSAQLANGGRAEARVNLAGLHAARGEWARAERELGIALRLNPDFVPAWVNRADLARAVGDEARAESLLREALARAPDAAQLHHALGLALVRGGRLDEAIRSLERAHTLAPGAPRFAYVLGVALHSAGRTDRALEVLEEAAGRVSTDRDLLTALLTIHREAGHTSRALRWARALRAQWPDDPRLAATIEALEAARGPAPER